MTLLPQEINFHLCVMVANSMPKLCKRPRGSCLWKERNMRHVYLTAIPYEHLSSLVKTKVSITMKKTVYSKQKQPEMAKHS